VIFFIKSSFLFSLFLVLSFFWFCQPHFLYLYISKILFLTTPDVLRCKCTFADMELQLIAGDSQNVGLLALRHVCQRNCHRL